MKDRQESDSMGTVTVPGSAWYGAQTERARQNFAISGRPMDPSYIRTLLLIKKVAAQVNGALGELDTSVADAISGAYTQCVTDAAIAAHFPIDRYQTGSATSTNMNANEVLAYVARQNSGLKVHPNDHVNMGQSSNDVTPTTLHVSCLIELQRHLLPALDHLIVVLEEKAASLAHITKTGRTHLMDALPVRFDQILHAWCGQIDHARRQILFTAGEMQELAIGGTAVGTGVNCHKDFARLVAEGLHTETGIEFRASPHPFELIGAQDRAVALSGAFNTLSVALMKIANDLRWMNSGPNAGLGEITLEALQPGSSIMPGKVNPVVPEAVAMVAAQTMGLHTSNTIAGQSGNFELNVMLPLLANNLLEAQTLLSGACSALADKAIATFVVNEERVTDQLGRNPILVTALNKEIGYLKAAEIAKKAYKENRPVLDVAAEETDIPRDRLQDLLDPRHMT
ncbi:fumarate hydratase class II 1 [Kordiimonas sediminis]|uniref:fumarate hydratase n=1 Tax=Kordiimonas sediminis TaxID=1735581 RepID=A0A919AL04_9PROT|nr:class II fumarate hydratase [Kordiimonas sediminis]GHF14789.1 fumarate hydratase class II 1 [Kordiimonas sediminis]